MHQKLREMNEEDIENFFNPLIRKRGYEYYKNGAVLNPIAFENRIVAQVAGTTYYTTMIEIKEGIKFSCSCPYEGNCKHEAALLYMWVKDRDKFTFMEEVFKKLKEVDRGKLIETIEDIITYKPELIDPIMPFDENIFKRKIDQLFSRKYGYSETFSLVSELNVLLRVIKRSGNDAANFLDYAILKMLNAYENIDDSEGVFVDIVNSYISLYKELMKGKVDKKFVKKYFTVYMENPDFSEDVLSILFDLCARQELQYLKELAEKRLKMEKENKEELMEVILRVYEKLGENEKYVGKALQLLQIYKENDYSPYFYEDILRNLIKFGKTEEVIEFLENMRSDDAFFLLADAYEHKGDTKKSFEILVELFSKYPSIELVEKIKKFSVELGNWIETKEEIIKILQENGRYETILKFALKEKDIDVAMQYLNRCKDAHLLEKIARFIEKYDKEKKIDLLKHLAETFIQKGGRLNYELAVEYLKKVKKIMIKENKNGEWQNYINHLKELFRKKYGLMLEMEKESL